MRKLDHDLKRLEIAEVAARIIAADGMEALTTRNLAKAMGCSIGVLSHYFGAKAEIVLAAFNWATSSIDERLRLALHEDVSIRSLLPLIEAALPHDEQSRIEWKVRLNLWSYAAADAQAAKLLRRHMHEHTETLLSLIAILQRNGELRRDISPPAVAQTLMDLIHGMGVSALLELQHEAYAPLTAFTELIDRIRVPAKQRPG